MKQIVILGAGTGSTIMANRLARILRRELRRGSVKITLVDQDNRHVYQPGLLFVPFGDYTPGQIATRPWAGRFILTRHEPEPTFTLAS